MAYFLFNTEFRRRYKKTSAAIQAEVRFDFFAVTAKFRNSSFNVIQKQSAGTAVKASCAS